MTLSYHYGSLLYTVFAQTDQRNASITSLGPDNTEKNDSFSAIGQIASLVITVPDSGLTDGRMES